MQTLKVCYNECKDCGYCAQPQHFDRQFGDMYCPQCESGDVAFKYVRDAAWYSIAAYSISREYGGPEEGGWYYDSGEVLPDTLRGYDAS